MAKKDTSQSSPVKGTLIIGFIKLLAYLPMSVSRLMTGFVAWLIYHTHSTSRQVTEINLTLCYPHLSDQQRDKLTRESLSASSLLMSETAKVWIRPTAYVLPMITEVTGEHLFKNLCNDPDKGILLISPHLGNWELLYTYLAYHYKSFGLYRPPKIAELGPVILAGRERSGGQAIRTTQADVRKMLKVLKNADSLFLLPDQQPQQGSGVFAPFFGHQAYTMTLLQGLAQRTGAEIMMVTCTRADFESSKSGFKLSFSPVNIEPSISNEQFAEQLNLRLREEIDKTPAQYEWAYKRFKASPEGVAHRYRKKSS